MASVKLYSLWEDVSTDTSAGITTKRLSVQGGWLVLARDTVNGSSVMEFVSDPQHEWVPSQDTDVE